MLRINKRKYSYTVLLALSFLAAAGIWKAGIVNSGAGIYAGMDVVSAGLRNSVENENTDQSDERKEITVEEPVEAEPAEIVTGHPSEEIQAVSQPVMYKADASYFDDALFIGDSRTVGLHEYGDLGNAEVIADSGMSVYKIFKAQAELPTGEKGTLEELLSGQQFGKIYVMLGINELGYDFDATVSRYEDMINRIQELQPDAILFLEANLHITKRKSETSPIYNNENINRFNEAVAGISDDTTRFYLDVNELFDDEEGSLDENYTVDDAHVLGKYYSDWVDWILGHAVKFSDD